MNIPKSSRTGLSVVAISMSLGCKFLDTEENVSLPSAGVGREPRLVSSCLSLWCSVCCCPCFSCNSRISLVKSLSERSRNRLQIPKSSPWNSLQSWKQDGCHMECRELWTQKGWLRPFHIWNPATSSIYASLSLSNGFCWWGKLQQHTGRSKTYSDN